METILFSFGQTSSALCLLEEKKTFWRLNHRTHFGKRTFQELNIWLKWPKCQPQLKCPVLGVHARALLFLLFLQLHCVQYVTSLTWDNTRFLPHFWPQFLWMCCCRIIWLWVIQSLMADALCTKSHYVLVCSHGPDIKSELCLSVRTLLGIHTLDL